MTIGKPLLSCAWSLLAAAACSAGPRPLPAGPPPEYEQPRSYDPQTGNIDTLGAEGQPPQTPTGSPAPLPGSSPPMLGLPALPAAPADESPAAGSPPAPTPPVGTADASPSAPASSAPPATGPAAPEGSDESAPPTP